MRSGRGVNVLGSMARGIVQRAGAEHGDEHRLQAIGDAAQSPAMTVLLGPQGSVALLAAWIPVSRVPYSI